MPFVVPLLRALGEIKEGISKYQVNPGRPMVADGIVGFSEIRLDQNFARFAVQHMISSVESPDHWRDDDYVWGEWEMQCFCLFSADFC
jgi:hypothetical protein